MLLADNPDAMEKVQIEIENANTENDLKRYIDRQDTLLHWSFLEALRLEPIPGLLSRSIK